MSRPLQVWLLVIGLSLLWGSSFLLLKRVLYLYSPIQVFAGRMLFAGIWLIPLAWRKLRRIPADKWPPLLAIAIIANFATTLLNAFAQVSLASALAGILNSLTPLMTLFVGLLFFNRDMLRGQFWGVLLGLVGTTLLVLTSSNGAFGEVNFAAFLVIGATLCHAFTNHIIRSNLSSLTHMQVAGASFLLISPVALLAGWSSGLFEQVLTHPENWETTIYLAFLGMGANAVALLIVARIVQLSSPVNASMVNYIIPIVAVGWGIYDGEPISLLQILFMVLIIACVWLVNRKQDNEEDME